MVPGGHYGHIMQDRGVKIAHSRQHVHQGTLLCSMDLKKNTSEVPVGVGPYFEVRWPQMGDLGVSDFAFCSFGIFQENR